MNRKYMILSIILAALLVVTAFTACSKKDSAESGDSSQADSSGAQEEQGSTGSESSLNTEVESLLNSYFSELNSGNYENIRKYFKEGDATLDAKIANFEFMATMFNMQYELLSVDASEDANGISASVVAKLTSTNLSTNDATALKEPSTYILERTSDGSLIILSCTTGESEIVTE